jgi:ATP-binding cassette subfamily B protein
VHAGDEADAFFIVYSGRARVVAINKNGQETTVGTLSRGDSFGEQGLLTKSHRNYSIRASTDLAALRLAKTDFDDLVERHSKVREYFDKYISEISIRNFLKLSTALAPLSPLEIRNLLGSLEVIEYEPDTAIIREGDDGDAFFILRTGGVRVVKESSGGQVLNHLKAGDSFGELALLTGQPRATSVIASEPSSVFRLSKREFDRIIAASPKFKDAIVSLASGYSATDLTKQQNATAAVVLNKHPQLKSTNHIGKETIRFTCS